MRISDWSSDVCSSDLGLIAVAAASPASAVRYSGDHHHIAPLYYFWRQLAWVAISLPVMFFVSMLPVQTAKRLALIGCAVCVALLMAVPFIGAEVNGAGRGFSVGGGQVQAGRSVVWGKGGAVRGVQGGRRNIN